MNSQTIETRKGLPVKTVAIALALAASLSILAMQGMALVTGEATHPVAVQQGSSDLGSGFAAGTPCPTYKSPRAPLWCLTNPAGHGHHRNVAPGGHKP